MVSLLHHRDTFSRQIQILVRVTRVPGDTGKGLPGYPEILVRFIRVPGDTGKWLPGYLEILDKGFQGSRRYCLGYPIYWKRLTKVPGDTGKGY